MAAIAEDGAQYPFEMAASSSFGPPSLPHSIVLLHLLSTEDSEFFVTRGVLESL